ncbi:MAG: hypothetical protein R2834_22540 [Rhodothermales bacterium]
MELQIRDHDEPYGRPLAQILTDLRKPIPAHIIQNRQVGGRRVKYLNLNDTIAILDQFAPGWEGAVTNIYAAANRIHVSYRLTIHAEEGKFSREATGSEPMDAMQGDPVSNAESNAFRNAAAKFGLALYL